MEDIPKPLKTLLKRVYYTRTDPGSLGGVNKFIQSVKQQAPPHLQSLIKKPLVEEWLRGQQGYTLHKPALKHFPRRPIIAGGIDQQWQADLADIRSRAKANDGYGWILTVVDTFSKFAWAVTVKFKNASHMVDA